MDREKGKSLLTDPQRYFLHNQQTNAYIRIVSLQRHIQRLQAAAKPAS